MSKKNKENPEILVETNLNIKLKETLAKKLGEELISLSGLSWLPEALDRGQRVS